jgi:hypothetical protein
VQIQVGSILWKSDPYFKFHFLLPIRVLLYGFNWGYLSLTLVQTPSRIFVKRMILLISRNEKSDCYAVSSVFICDLLFFF